MPSPEKKTRGSGSKTTTPSETSTSPAKRMEASSQLRDPVFTKLQDGEYIATWAGNLYFINQFPDPAHLEYLNKWVARREEYNQPTGDAEKTIAKGVYWYVYRMAKPQGFITMSHTGERRACGKNNHYMGRRRSLKSAKKMISNLQMKAMMESLS